MILFSPCQVRRHSIMSLQDPTITFLFTDIEGSTRLWEEHPAQMRLALAQHDQCLRQAIESHHGHVFKTGGDAFCAAFPLAIDAIAAALAAQQTLRQLSHSAFGSPPSAQPAPADTACDTAEIAEDGSVHENADAPNGDFRLRVRMALHTGAAQRRDNDYFGRPLNRTARLLALAHGGQTLLSQTTRALVKQALPEQTTLEDMGEHQLKDLQPEQVWQLRHPDLSENFPPLRSLNPLRHNLPSQLTSFIGREQEMQDVARLLTQTRLLTLTGSGGTGKTRLALQMAASLLDRYTDGVWLVELAPLADPALVIQETAHVLNVRAASGQTLLTAVADALKAKNMLLLLDNCEHLLQAAAVLTSTLLKQCPNVRVLVSSREALSIAGEQTYRVPSLTLPPLPPARRARPDFGDDPAPSSQRAQPAIQSEAVRLFADRAALVSPDFTLTTANGSTVARLCHRLDGIPLALELAAARVRVMAVDQIETRLDDRFRLLTGGSRAALPRQQTLRALIDWSYDLLTPQEQTMLQRLAVFADGWTLAAAEEVCALPTAENGAVQTGAKPGGAGQKDARGNAPDATAAILPDAETPQIETWEVLDLLTALVDKSLVIYKEEHGASRYRLLESVRQYALDKLAAVSMAAQISHQHRDFFLAYAEQASAQMHGPLQATAMRQLQTEQENLRAALEWSLQSQSAEQGARLALALKESWHQRGFYREGADWFARLLPIVESQVGVDRLVQTLLACASCHWRTGEYAVSRALLDRAVPLARAGSDASILRGAINTLANTLYYQGEFTAARPLYVEYLALARQAADEQGISTGLNNLALVEMDAGNDSEAQALLEEALALRRRLGNQRGVANVLGSLGELAARQGDHERATLLLHEAMSLSQQYVDKMLYAEVIRSLAPLRAFAGDRAEANLLMAECLQIRHDTGDKWGVVVALEDTASLITAQQGALACTLLAAGQNLRDALGAPRTPVQVSEHDRRTALLHTHLSEQDFTRHWERGTSLTLEEAVEHALTALRLPPSAP